MYKLITTTDNWKTTTTVKTSKNANKLIEQAEPGQLVIDAAGNLALKGVDYGFERMKVSVRAHPDDRQQLQRFAAELNSRRAHAAC